MRIHIFQHVPFEGLGQIETWAAGQGHTLTQTALFEPDCTLPDVSDYDALIIMGGPMGTGDEKKYPWLAQEKQHIRQAIDAGKHVLGVCLGAQLIADVLGANIAPHSHKEIGWFPIAISDEAADHRLLAGINNGLTVLHWHGDRFEIPVGALRLFSSKGCENQGFLYKSRVLGLQFHMEMDAPALESIVSHCIGEVETSSEFVQDAATILQTQQHYASNHMALYRLLDNWVKG